MHFYSTSSDVNTGIVVRFLNSLDPGRFEWNFRYIMFKRILVTDGWGIACEIALIWMSLDFINDQSTLVQVMVWCRQATSHYLSQCWPRSMSPYNVTRPQWVKILLETLRKICLWCRYVVILVLSNLQSSLCLQMAWHSLRARPSAGTQMTTIGYVYLLQCIWSI